MVLPMPDPLPRPRPRGRLILAGLLAALGWSALLVEFGFSLHQSFVDGRPIAAALFVFFRFFTILTNVGAAALMTVTLWRDWQRRPLPQAGFYAAMVVYLTVVGVTYELLLRALLSPKGVQFLTDMTMHDIVPVLTAVFWVAYAPKTSLRWRDPFLWLEFPAVYFVATIAAGALGAGYPYDFLDFGRLGTVGLLRNVLVFLVFFYGLGLILTGAARILCPDRTARTALRTSG